MIRAFRPSDAETLRAITLAAIHQIGQRGYNAAQVTAWAARHPDANRFVERWAHGDFIWVSCVAGDAPAAYAVMEPGGHLDMLYCHPDYAGRGLASGLLEAAEKAARSLALPCLFTEASELARPVFARVGYTLLCRRDFTIDSVPIHNYAMEKRL